MSKKIIYIFLIIIIIIIIIILLLAGYFILKNNKTTEDINIETTNSENLEQLNYKFFKDSIPYNDMTYFNNIYYKQINSLEEYSEFKTKVSSLPEGETNFNENFILVTMMENVSTQYLVPYKIYDENDTLYVGLIKDANTNPNSNAIIIEIPKSLQKDNIEPYKAIDEDIPNENYKSIKELPENYTADEAVNDNCYVEEGIEHFNKELVEEFIDNYNNSKDAFIRIVRISEDKETIMDIYYSSSENKFLVCLDNSRVVHDTTYNYYEYSNLDKKTLSIGEDGSSDYYSLTDSLENDLFLFYI